MTVVQTRNMRQDFKKKRKKEIKVSTNSSFCPKLLLRIGFLSIATKRILANKRVSNPAVNKGR